MMYPMPCLYHPTSKRTAAAQAQKQTHKLHILPPFLFFTVSTFCGIYREWLDIYIPPPSDRATIWKCLRCTQVFSNLDDGCSASFSYRYLRLLCYLYTGVHNFPDTALYRGIGVASRAAQVLLVGSSRRRRRVFRVLPHRELSQSVSLHCFNHDLLLPPSAEFSRASPGHHPRASAKWRTEVIS
jgi:hypothetical protein